MTPGTHTKTSQFFEEEEAADMPYSAYSVDGGVRGYGCVGDVDRVTMEARDNARSVYGEWGSWLRCIQGRIKLLVIAKHTGPSRPTFSFFSG